MDRRLVGYDLAVGEPKEVSHRTCDARMFLTVPGGTNDKATQIGRFSLRGYPKVANRTGAFDVAELHGLARLEGPIGRALSTDAKVAGRLAAFAWSARRILERDRSREKSGIQEIGLLGKTRRLLSQHRSAKAKRQQRQHRCQRHPTNTRETAGHHRYSLLRKAWRWKA